MSLLLYLAVNAAIHFANSTGVIVANYVTGEGYKHGVLIDVGATGSKSTAFITCNYLWNCIDGNVTGSDNGGIVFCNYKVCNGPGLKLTQNSSRINLSGVEHINDDPDFAGWNSIAHNVQTAANTGEIELRAASGLKLGTSIAHEATGHNTIITNGSLIANNNFLLIKNTDFTGSNYADLSSFGSGIMDIFWGNDATGGMNVFTPTGSQSDGIHMIGIEWAPSNPPTFILPFIRHFDVSCSANYLTEKVHEKRKPRIQSIEDDSNDECNRLFNKADALDADHNYKAENDTLRHYIESCNWQRLSFHAFVGLDGAVQYMSNDNSRWLEYRDWLKKVLYLSLDSLYYCQDANSILNTFQYLRPELGIDFNGQTAVIDYLLQNNRCPDAENYLLKLRRNGRARQAQNWRDTVQDSLKTPIDTTEPSLESLDLQILRGPEYGVASSHLMGPVIVSLAASENPFSNETTLQYVLNRPALIRIEIFDVLGRLIYSEGQGMQGLGKHQIILDGKIFAESSYYVRMSSLPGGVKSLRLVHEK
jgi:hypothetical protein